ncbi:MAG: hypothetical protein WC685_08175 [Methylobacter sp.]|jgi:hypothetical protein
MDPILAAKNPGALVFFQSKEEINKNNVIIICAEMLKLFTGKSTALLVVQGQIKFEVLQIICAQICAHREMGMSLTYCYINSN